MQKKLLGLAVAGALAAPVAALAQVEVYGTIHMSINSMKYGEGTGEFRRFPSGTSRRTPPTSAYAAARALAAV